MVLSEAITADSQLDGVWYEHWQHAHFTVGWFFRLQWDFRRGSVWISMN